MNKEKLEKILSYGIDMNIYAVLQLADIGPLPEDVGGSKFYGWRTLAEKKGLLENGKLTVGGLELLKSIEDDKGMYVAKPKVEMNKMDEWVSELHSKLKEKLKSIINKTQVMGFGNVYFIPGEGDLKTFLNRFNKNYKISLQDNKEIIEKCLLKHVEVCARANKFSPAVKYYIIKEGTGSQLAAAMDNYEESEDESKQFTTVKTKEMF